MIARAANSALGETIAARGECSCTHICRLHLDRGEDGPFSECNPKERRYFTISITLYIKGADGEPDRDYEFYPARYATLDEALRVVSGLPWGDYTVDDTPRMGASPPFRGWPEDADRELRASNLLHEIRKSEGVTV